MSSYSLEGKKFVVFGRSTGMGAYTDAVVYGPTGEEVKPVGESYSRSGNHWVKEWNLPSSFMVVYYDRTNSGRDRLEIIETGKTYVWKDKQWYKGLSAMEIRNIWKEYLLEVDE